MDSRQHAYRHTETRATLVCVGLLGMLPALGFADGARLGQKAKPGEIVVIRNVAARPADRPATAPGMALLVSASPNPQLLDATAGSNGPGEITDSEIADLNAGPAASGVSIRNDVQHSLRTALGTNTSGSSSGAVSSNGVSNALSAPTAGASAVADSTRNIGEQVTSAVSQIPSLSMGH
ncbi:hypothetical protein [Dyella flagellata]|uniref:Fap n=1 Tax=Dyella flagellata TaxID=1867833 RepID=A0ABQ5XF05_9GAMM|nr:hypothetical protein [Dyella flagellata]GLQ89115.1 hypothetical protein GCM10007898_26870 [Dyella flagellata]